MVQTPAAGHCDSTQNRPYLFCENRYDSGDHHRNQNTPNVRVIAHGEVPANVALTFSRIPFPRAGFRYRMVDSKSLCPSHDCTVRRSTPDCRCLVANVARNLCNQKSSALSSARSATALHSSSSCVLCLRGVPFRVGNTNSDPLAGWPTFPFHPTEAAPTLRGFRRVGGKSYTTNFSRSLTPNCARRCSFTKTPPRSP